MQSRSVIPEGIALTAFARSLDATLLYEASTRRIHTLLVRIFKEFVGDLSFGETAPATNQRFDLVCDCHCCLHQREAFQVNSQLERR
jgi:hypothetical protein